MLSLFDVVVFGIQEMNEFLESLASTYWKMDYRQFLERTGFVESDYALQKFKLFQQSAKGLLDFDPDTLASILASICNYFIMTQHKSLDLLLSLRNTAIEVQREIEVIMPDAIAEALKLAETSKNKVVYHNKEGRIVLVLKKRFATNKEDTKLARLDEDIQRITGELANKHSEQIADIESQIANHRDAIEELEKQQAKLLSDRRISTLKKQYHEHRESTLSLDPNLSVFLN